MFGWKERADMSSDTTFLFVWMRYLISSPIYKMGTKNPVFKHFTGYYRW